jgi:hypothetical protein
VVQQQESILFAVDGGTTHMHVRIVYAGPPQEFGWLLPVPRGVETTLSSEGILGALDAFQATFGIGEWERQVQCEELPPPPEGEPGFDGADAGAPNGGGEIQVLSREPVGPYDRAILDARTVEALRTWLQENGYQIPEGTDDKLRPYIDQGAVFVAIKLLPGEDVGDIVPLHLSFPGDHTDHPHRAHERGRRAGSGAGRARARPEPGRAAQLPARADQRGRHRLAPVRPQQLHGRGRPGGGRGRRAGLRHGLRRAPDGRERRRGSTPRRRRCSTAWRTCTPSPSSGRSPARSPCSTRTSRACCGRILLPPDFESGQEPTYLDCAGPVANPADEVVDGAALAERVRTRSTSRVWPSPVCSPVSPISRVSPAR